MSKFLNIAEVRKLEKTKEIAVYTDERRRQTFGVGAFLYCVLDDVWGSKRLPYVKSSYAGSVEKTGKVSFLSTNVDSKNVEHPYKFTKTQVDEIIKEFSDRGIWLVAGKISSSFIVDKIDWDKYLSFSTTRNDTEYFIVDMTDKENRDKIKMFLRF